MAETQTEMTEEKPVQKVMSGFAKRNANAERIEKEEQELKELMSGAKAEPTEESEGAEDNSNNQNLSPEEKTFKKRYGDLRRHSQKKEFEFQKQIDDLRAQLDASTKKEIKYPKSEAELSAWMERYPDVAKIVETIAMKKAHEQASEFETKFKQIDDMKSEARREKAEAELMRMHPDFDEIRESNQFHNWVAKQPKWIQDALYDNEADAMAASRAIDLYKADMKIKRRRNKNKDAAQSVNTRGERNSPESDRNGKTIRESEVMKMSAVEYERMSEAVAEAIRTGNFVYDVSGSAR